MAEEIFPRGGGLAQGPDGALLDMPRELASEVETKLIETLTLLRAIKAAVEDGCSDAPDDNDNITSPRSRAVFLLHMTMEKVVTASRQVSSYAS
ncbi:MAG: hypothetical protein JNL34_00135 [Anaerolineae bacterium]|nr:hypothetical protein [Anaerolineae bacterium]